MATLYFTIHEKMFAFLESFFTNDEHKIVMYMSIRSSSD